MIRAKNLIYSSVSIIHYSILDNLAAALIAIVFIIGLFSQNLMRIGKQTACGTPDTAGNGDVFN